MDVDELMAAIRYQVFAPQVTTMGCCPLCGKGSRGARVCAECRAKELDTRLSPDPSVGCTLGTRYLRACLNLRDAQDDVMRAGGEAE